MNDFVREPLIRSVRRIAESDLSGDATSVELKYLYDNPLLWLRALTMILREVETHIAKDNRSLTDLKPAAGTHPSAEYLRLKYELDERTGRRLHFKQIVRSRVEDAKSMIGPEPVNFLMVGDLVEALMAIAESARHDDFQAVEDRAKFWVRKLTGSES